ncbi:MAG TPA: hypothetical protein VNM48_23505 [Chloroflexota bacterium]|nr:hypothetical protein [Chloroflexota bacterium]
MANELTTTSTETTQSPKTAEGGPITVTLTRAQADALVSAAKYQHSAFLYTASPELAVLCGAHAILAHALKVGI